MTIDPLKNLRKLRNLLTIPIQITNSARLEIVLTILKQSSPSAKAQTMDHNSRNTFYYQCDGKLATSRKLLTIDHKDLSMLHGLKMLRAGERMEWGDGDSGMLEHWNGVGSKTGTEIVNSIFQHSKFTVLLLRREPL